MVRTRRLAGAITRGRHVVSVAIASAGPRITKGLAAARAGTVAAVLAAGGGARVATRRFDDLRSALGAGAAATLSAMATGARRTLGPAAYAAGVLAFVYLAALGWRDSPPSAARERGVRSGTRGRTVSGELNSVPGAHGPPLEEAAAALRDPSISEEKRLLLVDELARDPSDAATAVLFSIIDSPSLLVSMASIRALRGRPCDLVETPLLQWTRRGGWQHRAWAAKVLGENGCTDTAPELRLHLARERDSRVRRELATALATLGAGIPG
jgi:hypothetical protein